LISLLPGCTELWSLPAIGLSAYNVVGRWLDVLGGLFILERPSLRVHKHCKLTMAKVQSLTEAYMREAGRTIPLVSAWL
jgi:hypothetical protein